MARSSFLVAGVTITVFVAIFVYALVELFSIQQTLDSALGERNLWATTQAERELYRLQAALATAEDTEEGRDRVAFQFDLLHSRIALLGEGPQLRFLEEIGEAEDIGTAQAILTRLDPAQSLTDGLARSADLQDDLAALSDVLRRLSNRTMLAERQWRADYSDHQKSAMNLLLAAVSGAFLTGLAMALQLLRYARGSDLARRELVQHQAMLEETIAQRTGELETALTFERRARDVYRSFVVMVSHQFRTPVSVIHMIAQRQLRAEDPAAPEVLKRKFESILSAAERLERLLRGILSPVNLAEEQMCPALRPIDMNEVVRSALDQTAEANPSYRLCGELAEEALAVDADPVLLEQVVLNLLGNAVKYSPAEAGVRVLTRSLGDAAELRIIDRGVGIPEQSHSAVFEKFYRASNAQMLPGFGIGLSLSRDIIALHSGEISFRSTEGVGTEFIVTLPFGKISQDESIGNKCGNSVY